MPTELFAINAAIGVEVMYSFTVDGNASTGELSPDVTSVGELEEDGGNVSITSTSTGYNVSGKTGDGFGDAFEVNGTIRNWSSSAAQTGYTLQLGGERVGANDFPVSTEPDQPDNRDPTVSITNIETSPSEVSATASASDPDGNLDTVQWELYEAGNDSPINSAGGESVSFSLSSAGTYTLGVVATDAEGSTGTSQTTFEVGSSDDGEPDDGGSGIGVDRRTLALGVGAFGLAFVVAGAGGS